MTFNRGLRGLVRAPMRSGLIFAVLAASMALALVMLTVSGAFASRLDEVKRQVGTTITVQPSLNFVTFTSAGGPGASGGVQVSPPPQAESDSITTEDATALAAVEGVTSIVRTTSSMLEADQSDLVSGIDPDDLGGGIRFQSVGGTAGEDAGITIPISVRGTDASTITVGPVGDTSVTAGRPLGPADQDANVAVLGKSLAEANGLDVGDTFTLGGESVEVVGVFSSEIVFVENTVILPFDTMQRLLEQDGSIQSLELTIGKPEQVIEAAAEIREIVGDKAQVVTQTSEYDRVAGPLNDARKSSSVALGASLIVAALVIVFSVGLVARQRIKEIGILKAMGASSRQVTAQLGSEAALLSVGAAVVGALLTFPIAGTVADGLVSEPPPVQQESPFGQGPQIVRMSGGGVFQAAPVNAAPAGTGDTATSLLESIDAAASLDTFAYAIAIGLGLAMVAALVPAWYASRIRPAEVLRYD